MCKSSNYFYESVLKTLKKNYPEIRVIVRVGKKKYVVKYTNTLNDKKTQQSFSKTPSDVNHAVSARRELVNKLNFIGIKVRIDDFSIQA